MRPFDVIDTAESPRAYATRLATYMSDPSTIRVRTLEAWGHAPSHAEIARIVSARQSKKSGLPTIEAAARAAGYCAESDTGDCWRPRTIGDTSPLRMDGKR